MTCFAQVGTSRVLIRNFESRIRYDWCRFIARYYIIEFMRRKLLVEKIWFNIKNALCSKRGQFLVKSVMTSCNWNYEVIQSYWICHTAVLIIDLHISSSSLYDTFSHNKNWKTTSVLECLREYCHLPNEFVQVISFSMSLKYKYVNCITF